MDNWMIKRLAALFDVDAERAGDDGAWTISRNFKIAGLSALVTVSDLGDGDGAVEFSISGTIDANAIGAEADTKKEDA